MKQRLIPMLVILAALPGLAIASVAYAQSGADADVGAAIAARVCVACHGPSGFSPIPNTPRLAGLHAGYLVKQMRDYREGKRAHEVMSPTLADLTLEDFQHVAAYYAAMDPIPAAVTAPSLLPLGRTLYHEGEPDKGVPSCSGCHGAEAEGTRRFPRLAGQSVDYTVEQMRRFASGERTNDRGLMQTVADRLTEEETQAVAQYLASLHTQDAVE